MLMQFLRLPLCRHKLALVAKLTISFDKSKVARLDGRWNCSVSHTGDATATVAFADADAVAVAAAVAVGAAMPVARISGHWQPFVCPYST